MIGILQSHAPQLPISIQNLGGSSEDKEINLGSVLIKINMAADMPSLTEDALTSYTRFYDKMLQLMEGGSVNTP